MKSLILVLALTGCTNPAIKCADDMVDLYGDLGAESSTGYEEMSGSDAHYEGIKWASDFIKGCVE